ncbi:MAG: hypothetical protein FJX56_01550 [Alphaproteobacteria bacterium]|nr:hypothetical protein [Alphaproteobacteria bacterium]
MPRMTRTPPLVLAALLAAGAPSWSAEMMDHSAHGEAAGGGNWTYADRGAPAPAAERWEMLPSGDGPMFVAAGDIGDAERCRALLASRRTLMDEATRARCAAITAAPSAPEPADAGDPAPSHRH